MKYHELTEKDPLELKRVHEELRDKLRLLRFETASRKLRSYHLCKLTRRDIARIKTVLQEKA